MFQVIFAAYTFHQKLLKYVLKRVSEAVLVLWIIATITFCLLRILPGGPFDQEKALPPEVKANIEAKYNLNAPLFEQYTDYITGIAQGDFGQSYKYLGRNVTDIIVESLPNSFQLGIYAIIVAFLIGIPAGVFAASKHNKWEDTTTMLLAISGVSLPSFFSGTNCDSLILLLARYSSACFMGRTRVLYSSSNSFRCEASGHYCKVNSSKCS